MISPHIASLTTVVGRASELDALRAAFRSTNVQVLTGMGGVGKTSLARAYAQRHRDDYGVLWWVRAEDPAAIDAEFRPLLEVLLPPGEAARVPNARMTAFTHLSQQSKPWLLVLDNVPDAAVAHDLLPAGDCDVLITSRANISPKATTVEPLATAAAIELLTVRSGDVNPAAAEALAQELGGLPLALIQAAGFAHKNAIDLATYHRLYRDRSAELHREGRPADYPHTVATTWRLAIDHLSEPAREMLNILAFYAPDAIPMELLFREMHEWDRVRTIGELVENSLIMQAENVGTVTMHRLVQVATRDLLGPEVHPWAARARALVAAAMPHEDRVLSSRNSVDIWNALRTHTRALLGHVSQEHPETLAIRHSLADWIGNVERSRDLLAELLPIRERVLGAEHPDTLRTRHLLAHWTAVAGDMVAGYGQFVRLLPIQERVLGVEHIDTLRTRDGIAYWTSRLGNVARARDLYAELLSMRKRALGAEHPQTLHTRLKLAECTADYLSDAARARDGFVELVPIQKRLLGNDHVDTLITRVNAARWTGKAGDAAGARDQYVELVPVVEQICRKEDRFLLYIRRELAHWTGEAGDVARAQELWAELRLALERVPHVRDPGISTTRETLNYWAELAFGEEEEGSGQG
ncbi:tetratricopeptide repeat protein [Actinophytocola sp.]|uniref:tetratricopeptide repeat protein n=1 Tax=Actinophytocola sp. TaxID=1872138 RepID=UPI002D41F3B8|nr:tetratricopeptide repeat protein [Actinophytocola sp.]HYQ69426.1 tetratricopeptide repeat protein [Actinophytocola sp.]